MQTARQAWLGPHVARVPRYVHTAQHSLPRDRDLVEKKKKRNMIVRNN